MEKKIFLSAVKTKLKRYGVSKDIAEQVVSEIEVMYDIRAGRGLKHSEIVEDLGGVDGITNKYARKFIKNNVDLVEARNKPKIKKEQKRKTKINPKKTDLEDKLEKIKTIVGIIVVIIGLVLPLGKKFIKNQIWENGKNVIEFDLGKEEPGMEKLISIQDITEYNFNEIKMDVHNAKIEIIEDKGLDLEGGIEEFNALKDSLLDVHLEGKTLVVKTKKTGIENKLSSAKIHVKDLDKLMVTGVAKQSDIYVDGISLEMISLKLEKSFFENRTKYAYPMHITAVKSNAEIIFDDQSRGFEVTRKDNGDEDFYNVGKGSIPVVIENEGGEIFTNF